MNWLNPEEVREWEYKHTEYHKPCKKEFCQKRETELAEAMEQFVRAIVATSDDEEREITDMDDILDLQARLNRVEKVARILTEAMGGEK